MEEKEVRLRKKTFRHKLISMTIYAGKSNPFLIILLQHSDTLDTEAIALTRQEAEELSAWLNIELDQGEEQHANT